MYNQITKIRDKSLGAFLKAIGFIIALMDSNHASKYTKSIMPTLIKQFENPEE